MEVLGCGMLVVLLSLGVVVTSQGPSEPIVFPEPDGMECQLRTGRPGVCRDIHSCPLVAAKVHEEMPVHCGFEGRTPIVCCPIAKGVSDPVPVPVPVIDISPPTIDFECGDSVPLDVFPIFEPAPTTPTPLDSPEHPLFLTRLKEDLERQGFVISEVREEDGRVLEFKWSNGTHEGYEFFQFIAFAIGGLDARPLLAKYMALVGERDAGGNVDWFCDGILINKRWVLSAAHCFDRRMTNVVRLGEYDYLDDKDGNFHEDMSVARLVRHPDYTFPRAYHDLTLLELATDIPFNEHINPVCLSWGREADRNLESEAITLTGWGDTEFGGSGSSILQEVNVTVFPSSRCDQSYSTLPQYSRVWPEGIAGETLCAGDPEGGKDACQGDSGGPVVYLDARDRYTLAGVVSKGHGCGLQEFPGLYVDVRRPTYLAWIKSVAF